MPTNGPGQPDAGDDIRASRDGYSQPPMFQICQEFFAGRIPVKVSLFPWSRGLRADDVISSASSGPVFRHLSSVHYEGICLTAAGRPGRAPGVIRPPAAGFELNAAPGEVVGRADLSAEMSSRGGRSAFAELGRRND